jgi:hypothetical protein
VCVYVLVRGSVYSCACVCVFLCVWVGADARARARVALLIQHATCLCHVVGNLSDSTVLFDIIS